MAYQAGMGGTMGRGRGGIEYVLEGLYAYIMDHPEHKPYPLERCKMALHVLHKQDYCHGDFPRMCDFIDSIKIE